jgi:uncharacterized membrane protein
LNPEQSKLSNLISGNTFTILVFTSLLVRATFLYVVPPLLDVFYYDTQAVYTFLGLSNPYGHSYTNIPDWLSTPGAQNVFTYLPLVFLYLSPFGLIGDVRLGLITADLLVAWGIFIMMGRNSRKAALAYLFAPFSILFSTVYPNNTLVAMLFLSFAFVFEKIGKQILSALFFGLSLSSSQFSFLVYPFFMINKIRKKEFRWIAVSIAAFLAVTLPFLIWDPYSFIYDTIIFQFTRTIRPIVTQAKIGYNLNPSLSGIVYTLSGISVPSFVRILLVIVLFYFFAKKADNLKSILLNCSYFLVASMFILPNDFSWWFLELPFQIFLVGISLEI